MGIIVIIDLNTSLFACFNIVSFTDVVPFTNATYSYWWPCSSWSWALGKLSPPSSNWGDHFCSQDKHSAGSISCGSNWGVPYWIQWTLWWANDPEATLYGSLSKADCKVNKRSETFFKYRWRKNRDDGETHGIFLIWIFFICYRSNVISC